MASKTGPVKVLHVADKLTLGGSTLHGGTQVLAMCIPRFNKTDYDVQVCSLREKDAAGQYLEKLGISTFYLGRNKYDPRLLTDLALLVRKEGIQILHLHGYGASTLGRLVAFIFNIPAIVHEHMYDANIPTYQRWLDKFLAPITSAGIAISESVRDFLVSLRGLDPAKITVIHNGVPLDAYNAFNASFCEEGSQNIKAKYGIPDSHKLVAIVGRLHPIKGHEYFLKAAQEVLKNQANVTFLVVGDGDLLQSLQERVESLGIGSQVIFLGHCFDIPNLLNQIDIKVIASLSEGGPLTAFEAMAAGCAIVTTKVGVVPEILTDDETACFVPKKNSEAIAEKLRWLLANEKDARQMAEKAQTLVQRYDINQTVRDIASCYNRVLGM